MENLPAIELLEDVHHFPGPYMFKVIGKSEGGFQARAVAAMREALAVEADPAYSMRQTAGGRHIALTFQPTVQSAEHVLAIYRRLQVLAGLVMLW